MHLPTFAKLHYTFVKSSNNISGESERRYWPNEYQKSDHVRLNINEPVFRMWNNEVGLSKYGHLYLNELGQILCSIMYLSPFAKLSM